MSKFHSIRVADVRKETRDTVSIALDIPEDERKHFAYIQGQYLTFRVMIDGEDIRRTYSICTSPLDNEIRVAVKKLEGGKFSTWANEVLKPGITLEVMPPMGHFFSKVNPNQKKHYLAFAAGSGITPVMSILKTALAVERQSTFTLIYGNKGSSSIIFKEELEALKNKYMNRFALYHLFSREETDVPVLNGRITGEKCRQLFSSIIDPESYDEFFICGPGDMIVAVSNELEQAGIDKDKVHYELFTSPSDAGNQLNHAPKREIKKQFSGDLSTVKVILDGKQTTFQLATEGESILDAAHKHGADAPFACKGAVCCTCRAKLREGKVEMDLNYSLTDEEIANGFILTCQAHPVTENIVVDFDEA